MKLDSLSVVLLAYNEEEVIGATIANAARAAARATDFHEIVVIGFEGSSDRTNDLVRQLGQADPRIRLVLQPREEKGYGRAFALGLGQTRHDWILQSDADGQYDFDDLEKLVPYADDAAVAMVHGWRSPRRDPRERIAMAAVYNAALKVLYRIPLRDVDSAFKLMHGPTVRALLPKARSGFAVAELVIRLMRGGHKLVQVPIRHAPRAAGEALAEKGTANPFGLQLPSIPLVGGTLGEMWRMRAELLSGDGRAA